MNRPRQNFHCNFRAPDQEWLSVWLEFKERTKALGLDICFVTLSLCRVWLESQKEVESAFQLNTATQIVFMTQKNIFNYNVGKPRRERFQLDCSKNLRKCTLCSSAFEAYVITVARKIDREFCFRDFSEINHDFFRKLILHLRTNQKVLAMKPRTLPQFYILTEWKDRYPSMTEKVENNIVKPKFANNDKFLENKKGDSGIA